MSTTMCVTYESLSKQQIWDIQPEKKQLCQFDNSNYCNNRISFYAYRTTAIIPSNTLTGHTQHPIQPCSLLKAIQNFGLTLTDAGIIQHTHMHSLKHTQTRMRAHTHTRLRAHTHQGKRKDYSSAGEGVMTKHAASGLLSSFVTMPGSPCLLNHARVTKRAGSANQPRWQNVPQQHPWAF